MLRVGIEMNSLEKNTPEPIYFINNTLYIKKNYLKLNWKGSSQ